MKNKRMYVINFDDRGVYDALDSMFEERSYLDFANDLKVFERYPTLYEIDETSNGNVYIKTINNYNNKIALVSYYTTKNISKKDLKADIKEIRNEIKFRNED